jgi:hypothetical protein
MVGVQTFAGVAALDELTIRIQFASSSSTRILMRLETKTTQNFDAEFGKAVASVVTAQTKSGSNKFHGRVSVTSQKSRIQKGPNLHSLKRSRICYGPSAA